MTLRAGVIKLEHGNYGYKGWTIRKLAKGRWRGIKRVNEITVNSITRESMQEVCDEIIVWNGYREQRERKSI